MARPFIFVGDTANGSLAAFTQPSGVGSGVIATNVQSLMLNINATCYVRAPFTATGPGALTSLSLRMHYNDGYLAYLSGTLIAQKNAPAAAVFNSTATAARTDAQSLIPEPVKSLPTFRKSLTAATSSPSRP